MTRKLLLSWDPEIDGPFRRRLERALSELQVDHADETQIDADPDAPPPVRIAIASPASRFSRNGSDLVILGGPGDAQTSNGVLRLEATDIDNRTRRWLQATERLGQKLSRPGLAKFAEINGDADARRSTALAFPADPLAREFNFEQNPGVLADRLAAITQRAETAEEAIARAKLDESNALRERDRARTEAATLAARVAELEQRNQQLAFEIEATAFALSNVPPHLRAALEHARDHAARARLAAAHAMEAAQQHPDALRWKSGARYSGETRNKLPHGHGVMIFERGGQAIASYRGAFIDGRRTGHGIATSDGYIWRGEWANDEACGFGLLETHDGRRYEGEVAPGEDGSPRAVRNAGHEWPSGSKQVHQPAPLQLT